MSCLWVRVSRMLHQSPVLTRHRSLMVLRKVLRQIPVKGLLLNNSSMIKNLRLWQTLGRPLRPSRWIMDQQDTHRALLPVKLWALLRGRLRMSRMLGHVFALSLTPRMRGLTARLMNKVVEKRWQHSFVQPAEGVMRKQERLLKNMIVVMSRIASRCSA